MSLIERLKKVEGKITYIVGVVCSLLFVYNTYIKDNPVSLYIKNQQVQSEALDAEYDLDKVVFRLYHLRLYHSNKNDKGQFKFSYLKHKGRCYKAWVDPTSGMWVYKNGGDINFIKELSK